MARALGVDFGTTNSALALADGKSPPELVRFALADGGETTTFRSILYFEREHGRRAMLELAGPEAIERYFDADEPGRLIQSLKSSLAARDFSSTSIFGHPTVWRR